MFIFLSAAVGGEMPGLVIFWMVTQFFLCHFYITCAKLTFGSLIWCYNVDVQAVEDFDLFMDNHFFKNL